MTNRIYIGSDRVTMSKPGYDAVSPPAVDYKYLALDSRLNSGRPLEIGLVSIVFGGNYNFTTTYAGVPGVDLVVYGATGSAGAYAYAVPVVMRDANASIAYNRTNFYLAVFNDHFQVVDDAQYVRSSMINTPHNAFYVAWQVW
jgi:hypothetical protein